MIALLTLGLTLSLDNFRDLDRAGRDEAQLAHSVTTSLTSGMWGGLAPLVGLIVGQFLSGKIDDTAELIAAAGFAGDMACSS